MNQTEKERCVMLFVESCIVTKASANPPKDFHVTERSVNNHNKKIGFQLLDTRFGSGTLKVFKHGTHETAAEVIDVEVSFEEYQLMKFVYDKTYLL